MRGPARRVFASPVFRMKKLGKYLVEKGWLTVPQVKQALQHQRVFGGRLGTCLLELNLLSEDRLSRALSEMLSLPIAPVETLRNVDEAARDLLPARMACKSRVVVFEAYATEASVCLLDSKDLLLQDEIAFVVSKRLKFHVAPEVRIYEALARFYHCDIEARYQRIWDRLNRARYMWKEQEEAASSTLDETPAIGSGGETVWAPHPSPDFYSLSPESAAPVSHPGAASPRVEPVVPPTEERPTPPSPDAPATEPAAPPAAPSSAEPAEEHAVSETGSTRPIESVAAPPNLEALEDEMAQAAERDRIAHLLLSYLRERFDRVLLFMVRAGEVAGWMGAGADVDQDRLERFATEFDRPSLFLNLREGSPFFRGPLLRMDGHRELAGILSDTWPKDCLAVPIHVKDRLVGVFYADEGGTSMQDVDMGEMQRIGAITSRAFERFLLRKKKDQHH